MMRARPREIVLLPDDRFWVRRIALVTETDAPPVREQVELALETSAPFPLNQLYYGYWTRPGTSHALVFAAYRKRFTDEETEAWPLAECVAPAFAAWLAAAEPPPGTTRVLHQELGVTVLHYAEPDGIPTLVLSVAWAEDEEPARRSILRDELIRRCGGSLTVEDIEPIEVDPGKPGDDMLSFKSGDQVVELTLRQSESLDIRDTQEIGARRRGRVWDRWLWRSLVAAGVIIGLSVLSEAFLGGAGSWMNAQQRRIDTRAPVVNEIMMANNLAARIEELRNQRLRPFEMIQIADAPRPESILFESTRTTGLYTLEVRARTTAQGDIDTYRRQLAATNGVVTVEIPPEDLRYGNGQTTFRMVVTFTPEVLAAGGAS